MQTHFFEKLLKVEQSAIHAFQIAAQAKKNEQTAASDTETLTVSLKAIQSELGEDFQAGQLIDQLNFIKRVSEPNESSSSAIGGLDSDRFQLTNFQLAESEHNETSTAPRMISVSVSTHDEPLTVSDKDQDKDRETDPEEAQKQDWCDKFRQNISEILKTQCFNHIRQISQDSFPEQKSVEFLYSSVSHSASLALRKSLLNLEDKALVDRLSISFLPSLNVSAKPFEFKGPLFTPSTVFPPNEISSADATSASSPPHLAPGSSAISEADIKKNQIAQLYEYYNGLLAQDQLLTKDSGKHQGLLPRLGNPHHFSQAPERSLSMQGHSIQQKNPSVERTNRFGLQHTGDENILVSDETILSVKRSLSRGHENGQLKKLVIRSGIVDEKIPSVIRKYHTKEILNIFKMCGRFQSPVEHPQPYGDKMDIEILTQLLTKKPQVVLEHMRSHKALPLMTEHSNAVTNKLLMNFTGQPILPQKAKTHRV